MENWDGLRGFLSVLVSLQIAASLGHTFLLNFFLYLTESEFGHDEVSGFGRHCTESIR